MSRQKIAVLFASLAGILFLVHVTGHECAGQSGNTPSPLQASGRLVFGPIEFIAPQDYWYFPRPYPDRGLAEGQTFVVTFFQSREDIPGKQNESQGLPGRPFLNFFLLSSRFGDFQSYYDAVSRARKARGISEDGISYRELPRSVGRLFDDMTNWNCREETIRQGPRPLFGLNCIVLGETGVIQMSAHGQDERDVLGTAPLLRDMMRSLTVRKPGRKGG